MYRVPLRPLINIERPVCRGCMDTIIEMLESECLDQIYEGK